MQSNERLGRRVSEKKPRHVKRIRNKIKLGVSKEAVIHYQVFKPAAGETSLSVDRLNPAPIEQAANIAKRDAEADNRTFYGWAAVLYEIVCKEGMQVRPSPVENPPNPYHADLYFPDSMDEEDEKIAYAAILAENAEWLDWQAQEAAES